MAPLSTTSRAHLKAKTFGVPADRKYPMPDREHAANAKARATQQFHKGNLDRGTYAHIIRMANTILGSSTE